MNNRILITGGQGFLGRHLAGHFLQKEGTTTVVSLGRSVACPGHFSRRMEWEGKALYAPLPSYLKQTLNSPRHSYERVDVGDRLAMTELLSRHQPTHIIHLAGQLRDEALEGMLKANVLAVETLMEAIRGANVHPKRVVMGSTGGVYGIPKRLPIHEDDACCPLNLYGSSKLAAEHVGRNLAGLYDIPVLWARIFNPVGPGQDERHLTSTLARQVAAIALGVRKAEVEVGPLTTTRDFIDGRDVANALWRLASEGIPGTLYNVGSGIETPIQDTLDFCLRVAKLEDVHIKQRPARPSDVPRHVADITRLKSLGFQPSFSFAQSIGDLVDYYREDVANAPRLNALSTEPLTVPPVSVVRRHTYSVAVEPGLLKQLPDRLSVLFPKAQFTILSDATVHGLYGKQLLNSMMKRGMVVSEIILPEGETSKSSAAQQQVINALHEHGFDRRSVLINLGGGMISDVGGYVAATYMRGVDYVNVPTTLLAQHDAAIGGKVAVNSPWAKNFIGAFHQPRAVYIDPECLKTLQARDIGAGIAEAIKVGLCGDRQLLFLLEEAVERVQKYRDLTCLQQIVTRAATHKLKLLEPDPYEVDLRRVLNLGHSFGHALETHLHYTDLRHGEAVAWGLAVATCISLRRGLCDGETHHRILTLLTAYGLPPFVKDDHLFAALRHLKGMRLVRAGCLNMVLPTSFGSVSIVADLEEDAFVSALNDFLGWQKAQGRKAS